jgi:protein TonB
MSSLHSAVVTTQPGQPEPAGDSDHLSVRPADAGPVEVHFLFEQQQKRIGGALGVSVLTHVGAVLLVILITRLLPHGTVQAILPDRLPDSIVWLTEPGPGGGGGGGGNKSPEPPKQAELPGKEKITVPAVKPPAPTPEVKPETPKPEEQINIPAQTMAAAAVTAPGAIESNEATSSQGTGTGGGAYRPGNGVTTPILVREVKPAYTAEAMRAKVQGTVVVECVVLPDGSVGNVQVLKSLDSTFGLDQEAIKAARQWRFRPGLRLGEPVPVLITIELSFTLR